MLTYHPSHDGGTFEETTRTYTQLKAMIDFVGKRWDMAWDRKDYDTSACYTRLSIKIREQILAVNKLNIHRLKNRMR